MIYVCIPTHNEASTVGVLLWKTRNVLGEFDRDYRLVVHDDASTDETPDVLQRYRRSVPLTILRSEERIGYGASVERLLRHVKDDAPYPKRDCAVVLQADFTESPEDIVSLVKVLEGGADIVAGVAEEVDEEQKPTRMVRWAARKFLRGVMGGAPISDPLPGLRAYRIIVLKKAFRELEDGGPLIRSDGWAANVELLGKLAPHARRIAEVPTRVRYDLKARPSRFRPWRTFLGLAKLRGSIWSNVDVEAA
ncbi:MAG: glycosyltransferase family 2 protein [Gemmatimonadetes bacterium]|nr:glycosyltransferase family 2 protein [Gemmatimonadota bacterium]NNF12442.1 glycosyltransferase family 2 protein [Gemmatimonadota bacterium]NNL30388.1 glycosyltransferase family 2 protein [Gemmatimonadota bacterium]